MYWLSAAAPNLITLDLRDCPGIDLTQGLAQCHSGCMKGLKHVYLGPSNYAVTGATLHSTNPLKNNPIFNTQISYQYMPSSTTLTSNLFLLVCLLQLPSITSYYLQLCCDRSCTVCGVAARAFDQPRDPASRLARWPR